MPANKIEKLNWEPPVAFQCKVNKNISLPLENYLATKFEFCDPLVRLNASKKIISGYDRNYLINQLKKVASTGHYDKASNAFYLLILMSDFLSYVEAKNKKENYFPKHPRDKEIHEFIAKIRSSDSNCGWKNSIDTAKSRILGDLAQVQIHK